MCDKNGAPEATVLFESPRGFGAVQPRHLNIEDDCCRSITRGDFKRRFPAIRHAHVATERPEKLADDFGSHMVVINDEDSQRAVVSLFHRRSLKRLYGPRCSLSTPG